MARLKSVIHAPFYAVSDVLEPTHRPSPVVASLVSASSTPLYTALILLISPSPSISSHSIDTATNTITQLHRHSTFRSSMPSAQTFPSSSFRTPHPKLKPQFHLPLHRPMHTLNFPPSTPPLSPHSVPASSAPPRLSPSSAAKLQTASCAGAKSSGQSTPCIPLAGRVRMGICACHRR